MAWNSTTKIMTAPLNINTNGDIQQATRMSGHGRLNDCIVNGTINKWAKWKPERSTKITPLTFSDRQGNNFGLLITKYTTVAGLMSGIQGGGDWAYLRPRNNSTDCFRMFDFTNASDITSIGYRGDANCFLDELQAADTYTQGSGGIIFRVYWNTGNNLKDGSILPSELTAMDGALLDFVNLHIGVLMTNGTSYIYKTTGTTIASDVTMSSLSIDSTTMDSLATGSWYVYFFAAYTACTTVQTNIGTINTYLRQGAVSLPDIGRRSISIVAAATVANASIHDGDDGITITFSGARFTVAFDIAYKASSSSAYIYPTYTIYGGDSYGAKTTVLKTGSYTLNATTTTQYQTVSYLHTGTWPAYVTVTLTYTVGTSPTVYTAPEASKIVQQEEEE